MNPNANQYVIRLRRKTKSQQSNFD